MFTNLAIPWGTTPLLLHRTWRVVVTKDHIRHSCSGLRPQEPRDQQTLCLLDSAAHGQGASCNSRKGALR